MSVEIKEVRLYPGTQTMVGTIIEPTRPFSSGNCMAVFVDEKPSKEGVLSGHEYRSVNLRVEPLKAWKEENGDVPIKVKIKGRDLLVIDERLQKGWLDDKICGICCGDLITGDEEDRGLLF